ncbi:unnamed protein product [Pleuronectes platessa]|uniref:Uncharacterized protein n=1 Tax=Pleuronectes platessa TaxID=8262 RepID=A0A9N7VMV5_PLEPL|nr:unnamed protein product [Pleuronectes platessa]
MSDVKGLRLVEVFMRGAASGERPKIEKEDLGFQMITPLSSPSSPPLPISYITSPPLPPSASSPNHVALGHQTLQEKPLLTRPNPSSPLAPPHWPDSDFLAFNNCQEGVPLSKAPYSPNICSPSASCRGTAELLLLRGKSRFPEGRPAALLGCPSFRCSHARDLSMSPM